jgi:hypothetical protein
MIHQWVYDPPDYTTLTHFGPWDINNDGIVVGALSLYREGNTNPGGFGANAPSHGFIYNVAGGTVSIFDYPGASSTELYGISNSGILIGLASVDGTDVNFIYDGETFKELIFPGAAFTCAMAVNNSGDAVGYYVNEDNSEHGFRTSTVEGTIVYETFDYPNGSAHHSYFTLHEPSFAESPDVTITLDFLGEGLSLYEATIITTAIVETVLLSMSTTLNEVEELITALDVVDLMHLVLSPLSVRVISPTGTGVTITGLGMNMGLGPNM